MEAFSYRLLEKKIKGRDAEVAEKRREPVTLDRKSPPFARTVKGGAPSSSGVGRRNQEHSQEWLCHGHVARVIAWGGGVW